MKQEFKNAIIKVKTLNPKVLLSGSAALKECSSWHTEKEIGDLDFELPFGLELKTDNELVFQTKEEINNEYVSGTHNLFYLLFNGISINVFQPVEKKYGLVHCGHYCYLDDNNNFIECCTPIDIIYKKLDIALSDGGGKEKHLNDMIEILTKEKELYFPNYAETNITKKQEKDVNILNFE